MKKLEFFVVRNAEHRGGYFHLLTYKPKRDPKFDNFETNYGMRNQFQIGYWWFWPDKDEDEFHIQLTNEQAKQLGIDNLDYLHGISLTTGEKFTIEDVDSIFDSNGKLK